MRIPRSFIDRTTSSAPRTPEHAVVLAPGRLGVEVAADIDRQRVGVLARRRVANIVPIGSTPSVSPAASHQRRNSARPSPSASVSVWRLLPPATPGPISAISMIESQSRAPSILRFSPGAAMAFQPVNVAKHFYLCKVNYLHFVR